MPKIDLRGIPRWKGRVVVADYDPDDAWESRHADMMHGAVRATFEKTDPGRPQPPVYCIRIYAPECFPGGDFSPGLLIDMSGSYRAFRNSDLKAMSEEYHLETEWLGFEQAILIAPDMDVWEMAETWGEPAMAALMGGGAPAPDAVPDPDDKDAPPMGGGSENRLKELLKKAYAVVDCFRGIMNETVAPEMNTAFMTDDYEGLETACGLIGSALDEIGEGGPYEKILITERETRAKLTDAYRSCRLVLSNVRENSELSDAVGYLQACYYVILNATYRDGADVKAKIESCMEVCDRGTETLDAIAAMDRGYLEVCCLNPSLPRIEDRLDSLRKCFEMLRPRSGPDDKEA